MIKSFEPIAAADARVLILGSIPSQESLARGQYYAHPQNQFWPIMLALFGAGKALDYPARADMLKRAQVALWDTLQFAERAGSLDSAIVSSSEVPNDIAKFLKSHSQIKTIVFNGTKAEAVFRKHTEKSLPASCGLTYLRLPSTSPANAAIPYPVKLETWRAVVRYVGSPSSSSSASSSSSSSSSNQDSTGISSPAPRMKL